MPLFTSLQRSLQLAYLPWCISGILFALSFLHPYVWWLCIPAVWLFLHALLNAHNFRCAAVGGFLVGALKTAGGIAWVWSAYPITFIAIESHVLQLVLLGLHWLIIAGVFGIGLLTSTALTYRLIIRDQRWIYVFPFLFVAGEVLGSFLFSVLSLGPGSTLNVFFSFGYVGYLFASADLLLPLAVFGGVYSLTLLSLLCILFIFLLASNASASTKKLLVPLSGVLCVLVLYSVLIFVSREAPEHANIMSVSTQFPAHMLVTEEGMQTKDRATLEAVTKALRLEPRVLALSEDSRFTHLFETQEDALAFVNIMGNEDMMLIDSARDQIDGTTILRSYTYDTARNRVHIFDKQYLVPQGEYVPYLAALVFNALDNDTFAEVSNDVDYRPGPIASYEQIPNDIPGILFCFESVIPFAALDMASERDANLIVHPVSHSWFHTPRLLWMQLAHMLRVQSVWSNTPILQVGNMAESKLYYPNGTHSNGTLRATSTYWSIYEY